MAKINLAQMFTGGDAGAPIPARQMELAKALMQTGRGSANMIYSPAAGLAQAGAQAFEGFMAGKAARDEAKADAEAGKIIASLLMGETGGMGGDAATAPAPGMGEGDFNQSGGAASTPASGAFAEIGPRLMGDLMRDFDLTPDQAAGVVGNLAHETGGFRHMQEINPIVPGSRGGFGFAQWTGPRRRQFESWSQEQGLDPNSYEANYGFLSHELRNTPEGRVLGDLRGATDAQTAARVFSDRFLRPGIPHMDSRLAMASQALGFAPNAADMPAPPGAAPAMGQMLSGADEPPPAPNGDTSPMRFRQGGMSAANVPGMGSMGLQGVESASPMFAVSGGPVTMGQMLLRGGMQEPTAESEAAAEQAMLARAQAGGMQFEPSPPSTQMVAPPPQVGLMPPGSMTNLEQAVVNGQMIPPGMDPQAISGVPMPPDAPGGIVEQAFARQGGDAPMNVAPSQAAYASGSAPQLQQAPMQQMIDPNQYAGGDWIPPDVGRVLAARQMGAQPSPQDLASALMQQGQPVPQQAPQTAMASMGGAMPPQSGMPSQGMPQGAQQASAQPNMDAILQQALMNPRTRGVAIQILQQRQAAMQPREMEIREVGGRLIGVDPISGQSRDLTPEGMPEGQGFRIASQEESARYGAAAGQFGPDGRFYPINPPSGMAIESDGAGGIRVVQGPGAMQSKPFTETQSKDVVYATRARGALEAFESVAGALTGRLERAAEYDPTGIARGFQSDEFQVAKNAGDEFLQAILRKDTGAAITEQEQALYGETYLPRPGDNEAVLRQKAEARQRAIAAIEAGMSPAQMIAQERGIARGREKPGAAVAPGEYRWNPETGQMEPM